MSRSSLVRNLAAAIYAIGFSAQDARDIGLCGHPDTEVMQASITMPSSLLASCDYG